MDAYFERLGLQHESFMLPFSFYITKAFFAIMLCTLIFSISFYNVKSTEKNRLQALRGNLFFLFFAVLGAYQAIRDFPHLSLYLSLGIFLSVAFLVVSWTLRRKSAALLLTRDNVPIRILALVGAILYISFMARLLGSHHAKIGVEATGYGAVSIRFETKASFPESLEDMNLILIIYHNGNYYVMERQNPLPRYPKVYIVPDDQIEFAVQKRIN